MNATLAATNAARAGVHSDDDGADDDGTDDDGVDDAWVNARLSR
jgi:hypothetical protein